MFGLFGKKQKINATIEVVDPRDVPAHCFIAGNLHIRGDVMFSGSLRIDGRVDGKVCTFDGTKVH
jgi:cytoskeletal protein CcmA (bactofilin family)